MQIKRCILILLIGFYSQWVLASLPIQYWQTSSGARVYFVENHDLPMLDVSVEFGAGSGMDTSDKSGNANLVRHLLSLGAGGLSEDQIAMALADVGAQLNSHFDRDRAGIALRTLSSERERKQALDILARIIQRPEFPQDVLAREKARIISSIKESSAKPDYIAERKSMKMLYGSHPYGLSSLGEMDTLDTLQREDLLAFYRSYYVAGNAVIAIIGDVSRFEAAAIAELLTGNLSSEQQKIEMPAVQIPIADIKK
ncbi:MAG: pitrilysin family protein, partial [Pseudomonadota bacterium]